MQKKAFYLQQTHARATSTLSAVKAAWQIYDTKTVSHRNVSVTINWGEPTAVETYCNGVEKDGFLYIAQTCYYPTQRKGQNRQWLSSKWVVGEKEFELGQPAVNTSGLVIFELPVLSSNTQNKLNG